MITLKDLIKSSVYITPNLSHIATKRYKFNFWEVLSFVIAYSLLMSFFTLIFLIITPADKIAFFFENQAIKEEAKKVKVLEEKVLYLTNELKEIASKNKKLKYAMLLGTSDSLQNAKEIYDSLQSGKMREKKEGNILKAFNTFVDYFYSKDDSKIIFFIKPVTGYIHNDFAPAKGHFGIDFIAPNNTPIKAAQSGYIIVSDYLAKDGNTIIIKHKNDYISIYKHCSSVIKKERDFVEKGDIIGFTGNTGYNTTGSHLHFEIWKSGKPIDPKNILINLE